MKKILIVEDSAFTRNIHRRIIQSLGYESIEAAGGEEGLEVFMREKPDLVVTDLLMPDMDGMELVSRILQNEPQAHVIICSTDRQKYRREEALSLGVDAFLTKPIDVLKMSEAIESIIAKEK